MEEQLFLKGIVPITFKLLNILIHSLGFYLLLCLHKRCTENVQIIYIMNLSATELILNILSFIRNFIRVASPVIANKHWFKDLTMYSYIVDYAVFRFCLYMWMFYITIDRVCGVLLNMSYPSYWNSTKALYLVVVTWVFGFIVSISTALVYGFHSSDEENMFLIANYTIIIFDITFVVVAVISYGSIFHVFQKQRHNSFLGKQTKGSSSPDSENEESLWTIFRHSRFYVSVLIVSTFILFTIIPDFMWTFHVVENENSIGGFMLSTSYAVSYFIDGAIYIFMDDKVKNLLLKKLRIYKCLRILLSRDVHRENGVYFRNNSEKDKSTESPAVSGKPRRELEQSDDVVFLSNEDDRKEKRTLINPTLKKDTVLNI